MARKKKETTEVIETPQTDEKIMALVNGKMVEMTKPEDIKSFTKSRKAAEERVVPKYETLDRAKITDETKEQLVAALIKVPELTPIVEILIGKSEVTRIKDGEK